MQNKLLFLLLIISSTIYAQEITFPYVEKEGWPIVEVRINNHNYNFLFDTGAAMTVVNSNLFKGLIQTGEIELVDFNRVVESTSTTVLSEISLAQKKFLNHEVVFKDLGAINKVLCDVKLDGILGIDLMKDYLVEVDSQKQIINFFKKKSFDYTMLKNYSKNNYKHSIPNLKLKIGNQKRYAVFDTGNNDGLTVSDHKLASFINKNSHFKSYGRGSIGANSTKERTYQTEIINVKLEIGKLDIDHQNLSLNTHQENNAGFDFIKQFDFFLDVTDQVIYLKKSPYAKSNSSPVIQYGFWVFYNFETNQFYVSNIAENNEQLRLGDILTQINTIDFPQEFCDLSAFLKKNMATEMSLTIIRNGNEKSIEYSYN